MIDFINLSNICQENKPNAILILGDRFETLLAPLVTITNNIPLIHFYGGAVTKGAYDEIVRHGISKMSNYHFVALDIYKKRLIQMGEDKKNIKVIGLPLLNDLKEFKSLSVEELSKKLNFNFKKEYLLFSFHSETLRENKLINDLKILKKFLTKTKLNIVITYPNADRGSNEIIDFYKLNFKKKNNIKIIKNCGKELYFNLLNNCKFLIGNSSSGIVEAASFKKPVINIGKRQLGKLYQKNIVSTDYNLNDLMKAYNKINSKKFIMSLKSLKNAYESKISTKKIVYLILSMLKNKNSNTKFFVDLKN